ncbi:MAG: hypothetical protein Q7S06_00660 [Nanoarchaeota archaeon]|nr:hypothetical protein [Nanoarchaeota archaeon]
MVEKVEGVNRGDLVELTLKRGAKKQLDMEYWFSEDKSGKTDTRGRIFVGYVVEVDDNSIALAHSWNVFDREPERMGGIRFKFDAIGSYCKHQRNYV